MLVGTGLQSRIRPARRMKASSLGKDCILMWPCNDGTSRNVGGDPSGAANQAVFNPAFTSSSRNGNAFITRAVWAWDPRVGGFCFNNDASVGNAARDGLTTLNPNSEAKKGFCLIGQIFPEFNS